MGSADDDALCPFFILILDVVGPEFQHQSCRAKRLARLAKLYRWWGLAPAPEGEKAG